MRFASSQDASEPLQSDNHADRTAKGRKVKVHLKETECRKYDTSMRSNRKQQR